MVCCSLVVTSGFGSTGAWRCIEQRCAFCLGPVDQGCSTALRHNPTHPGDRLYQAAVQLVLLVASTSVVQYLHGSAAQHSVCVTITCVARGAWWQHVCTRHRCTTRLGQARSSNRPAGRTLHGCFHTLRGSRSSAPSDHPGRCPHCCTPACGR